MGYWDETDRILDEHGGKGPPCPECGKNLYPFDDHGRFFCECDYRNPALQILDMRADALRGIKKIKK